MTSKPETKTSNWVWPPPTGLLTVALLSANLNAAILHVWQESPSPGPPYDSWATAAHVIQDAVDAAVDGDTVLVTNGVDSTGGRAEGLLRQTLRFPCNIVPPSHEE